MKKLLAIGFVCLGFISRAQICSGSNATLTPPSTTLTNPSYTLNPGNFQPNQNGQFVISPTVTTNYTVIIQGQGTGTAGIVTQTAALTVTVFAQPSFVPTFTQSTCTSSANGFNFGPTWTQPGPQTFTISWIALQVGLPPSIPPQITSPQQYSATGGIPPGAYGAVLTSVNGCTASILFTITPQPSPATFSLIPGSGNNTYSITCYTPTLTLAVNNSNNTYTWSANSFTPVNTETITLTSANAGSVLVSATNTLSGCVNSKTLTIGVNTTVPISAVTPTFQNITCTYAGATTTLSATSPSVNFEHQVIPPAPATNTWLSNNTPDYYLPTSGSGTYTYILTNLSNGCKTQKTFSIQMSQNSPTFNATSAPINFTLGCNTKSVITLGFFNVNVPAAPGAPVSYTFLPPGSSSVIPLSGPLATLSTYTNCNIPGTWTLIARANSFTCDTWVPISVTNNNQGPKIDTVIVPYNVLTCNEPTVVMQAISETPNISFNWGFPPSSNLASPSITVNANFTVAPTNTLINHYTLTVTDLNNTCISTRTFDVFQNLFPPKAVVTAGGTSSITCLTQTIMLTNQSTSTIPPPFTTNLPVQGYIWTGPSPQPTINISSSYVAATPGFYTLTVKDLNNGCTSTTGTLNIGDNRTYPIINNPSAPPTASIDCGSPGALLIPIYLSTLKADYLWQMPQVVAGSILTGSSCLAPIPGIYTVTATNDPQVIGCSASATMSAVKGFLTGKIDPDVITGYAPLTVNFINNSFSANNSTSSITTVWGFGNGTSTITPSASINPVCTYSLPGTYTVTIFVTKNPCIDTVYKVISVDVPSKLSAPNVFTPNGDNINDFFFFKTASLTEITMVIYDRWGHKVYEITSNAGNVSWDGLNQYGKESAEGVYFYVVKAKGKDGATYDEKGNISLFR